MIHCSGPFKKFYFTTVVIQLILQLLSKWNGFDYYKLEPGDDPFHEEVKLSTFIKLGLKRAEKKKKEHQDKTWPVFVFKHHYYYNTSRNGLNSNIFCHFSLHNYFLFQTQVLIGFCSPLFKIRICKTAQVDTNWPFCHSNSWNGGFFNIF